MRINERPEKKEKKKGGVGGEGKGRWAYTAAAVTGIVAGVDTFGAARGQAASYQAR